MKRAIFMSLMGPQEPFMFLTPVPRLRPLPIFSRWGFREQMGWRLTGAATSGRVTEPQAKEGFGR